MPGANDDEIARRKSLTFAQAEGVESLPSQMRRTEVSKELRAVLWNYVYSELNRTSTREMYAYVGGSWKDALKNVHVYFFHRAADEFDASFAQAAGAAKAAVLDSDWIGFYGWLQHLLRVKPTHDFASRINKILIYSRSPYRVIDGEVLCPIGSDEEAEVVARAFNELKKEKGLIGGREHLKAAAQELTAGNFADSVRESMHAVESVVRSLEPSGEFSKALSRLEASTSIHGALKKGFLAIYGFSSDEQGIRHPLLDKAAPDVDEADAIFMIGACAAFVSYLINKARGTGLLK